MTDRVAALSDGKLIALITGANRGIGFEAARQLGELGHTVVLGARDGSRGRDAADVLRLEGIDAHTVLLDVTDQDSIAAAAGWLQQTFGRLDALVNNAAVLLELPRRPNVSISVETMRETYETNVFGPIAVMREMLPLVRRSAAGRIVNVSTILSLCGRMLDDDYPIPLLAYNSSKAALNAVTLHYARELRDTPIKVNIADPGHASTDLNHWVDGPSASAAARIVVELATLPENGPTGKFLNTHGALDCY